MNVWVFLYNYFIYVDTKMEYNKKGQYVYNTIKHRIEIQLVKYIGIRGKM